MDIVNRILYMPTTYARRITAQVQAPLSHPPIVPQAAFPIPFTSCSTSMIFHQTGLCLFFCLYLYTIKGSALPTTAPAPRAQSANSPLATHHLCSTSHLQVRNSFLAPQDASSGAPLNMGRFSIIPNLVILMSVSGPVENLR